MRDFIIISKCLRVTNRELNEFEFRFKGIYQGQIIRKVILSSPAHGLVTGDEYVIHVTKSDFMDGVLKGEVKRLKKLNQSINQD